MSKPKCKGCQDRHVGCHAKCVSYLAWQKEHLAELEMIRKIKQRENDIDECTIACSIKKMREWKRHGSK